MKNIRTFAILAVFALAFVVLPAGARAASSTAELLQQITTLNEQIRDLQKKLADIRGEQQDLRKEIKANLKEGMTDEDIREIQELFATDPDVYPRGLITGYYGPLTKDAIKKFQEKYDLEVTGTLNDETREYLSELFSERQGGKFPVGFLRMMGLKDRIERSVLTRCDGRGVFGHGFWCAKLKNKHQGDHHDDDANDDDDDDANDDDDSDDVESISVEFENNEAKVAIVYDDGDKDRFTYRTTDEDTVIERVAKALGMDEEDVENIITFAREDDDVESIDAIINEDDNETRVEVTYEDGDTDSFDLDTDSQSEIIDEIADELDMDEDDVEDLIDFEYVDDEEDDVVSIDVEIDEDNDEAHAVVAYEDGTDDEFDFDTTDEAEIIEELADELDMDEEDVEDVIEFENV